MSVEVIPDFLVFKPSVKVLLRDEPALIATKVLHEDLSNTEIYLKQPALIFINAGEQSIQEPDGDWHYAKAGDLLAIPPGIYFVSDFLAKSSAFKATLFFFSSEIIENHKAEFKVSSHQSKSNKTTSETLLARPKILPQNEAIAKFVQSIELLYSPKGDNGLGEESRSQLCRVKLKELLLLISSELGNALFFSDFLSLSSDKKLDVAELSMSYRFSPLSVDDLATISGRSLSSFQRDFKKSFRVTPKAWLSEQRMNRAAELLNNTQQSIADVGQQLGYIDASHFSRAFKRRHGSAPNEFRRLTENS
jgi:AraC-like DNA-binding protein